MIFDTDIQSNIKEKFKWIYINNSQTKYQISNYGYVISYNTRKTINKPHILKNNIMRSGYAIVCLYHNNKSYWKTIHRLVAEAFIPIPDKYIKQ